MINFALRQSVDLERELTNNCLDKQTLDMRFKKKSLFNV